MRSTGCWEGSSQQIYNYLIITKLSAWFYVKEYTSNTKVQSQFSVYRQQRYNRKIEIQNKNNTLFLWHIKTMPSKIRLNGAGWHIKAEFQRHKCVSNQYPKPLRKPTTSSSSSSNSFVLEAHSCSSARTRTVRLSFTDFKLSNSSWRHSRVSLFCLIHW